MIGEATSTSVGIVAIKCALDELSQLGFNAGWIDLMMFERLTSLTQLLQNALCLTQLFVHLAHQACEILLDAIQECLAELLSQTEDAKIVSRQFGPGRGLEELQLFRVIIRL